MLVLRNVSREFGSTLALRNVSFDVPNGQFVAVIGRSGAGKSTLLRTINRLVRPTAGEISFDGRSVVNLRGDDLRRWRASAAMIFQGFNLSPRLNVLSNVLVGASNEIPQLRRLMMFYKRDEKLRAAALLDDLGMLDKAFKRAENLSGGQQQRVAIARALMQKPKIILADEPIASLDPLSAKIVMDTLREINRRHGISVLCNLHSISAAREYGDRVIALRAGELVLDAPISALDDSAVREVYDSDHQNASDENVRSIYSLSAEKINTATSPAETKFRNEERVA
jgi:phosphonate transport system ATP-binding protein